MPKVKSLTTTTAITKVLMKELMGIEMMSLAATATTLILKDGFASVVFGLEFVVRQYLVRFPNVMEFLFCLFFVVCGEVR